MKLEPSLRVARRDLYALVVVGMVAASVQVRQSGLGLNVLTSEKNGTEVMHEHGRQNKETQCKEKDDGGKQKIVARER